MYKQSQTLTPEEKESDKRIERVNELNRNVAYYQAGSFSSVQDRINGKGRIVSKVKKRKCSNSQKPKKRKRK